MICICSENARNSLNTFCINLSFNLNGADDHFVFTLWRCHYFAVIVMNLSRWSMIMMKNDTSHKYRDEYRTKSFAMAFVCYRFIEKRKLQKIWISIEQHMWHRRIGICIQSQWFAPVIFRDHCLCACNYMRCPWFEISERCAKHKKKCRIAYTPNQNQFDFWIKHCITK